MLVCVIIYASLSAFDCVVSYHVSPSTITGGYASEVQRRRSNDKPTLAVRRCRVREVCMSLVVRYDPNHIGCTAREHLLLTCAVYGWVIPYSSSAWPRFGVIHRLLGYACWCSCSRSTKFGLWLTVIARNVGRICPECRFC
jgi:hypothetical protein